MNLWLPFHCMLQIMLFKIHKPLTTTKTIWYCSKQQAIKLIRKTSSTNYYQKHMTVLSGKRSIRNMTNTNFSLFRLIPCWQLTSSAMLLLVRMSSVRLGRACSRLSPIRLRKNKKQRNYQRWRRQKYDNIADFPVKQPSLALAEVWVSIPYNTISNTASNKYQPLL